MFYKGAFYFEKLLLISIKSILLPRSPMRVKLRKKRCTTAWKVSVFGVIWFTFSRIRTEYREILRISLYSVRMRKNTDQNNSKYGHLLRSVRFHSYLVRIMTCFFKWFFLLNWKRKLFLLKQKLLFSAQVLKYITLFKLINRIKWNTSWQRLWMNCLSRLISNESWVV